MILRPRATPHSLIRSLVRPVNNINRLHQRRSEHTVPHLGSNDVKGQLFKEHGVPQFLTPRTFKQTWLEYQQQLCDDLNSSGDGVARYEGQRPLELHQTLSHTPEFAQAYNYAAMLHFNHFFWESLASDPKPIPDPLRNEINDNFGSVDDLRIEMLTHADAMFGNGFVWLVREGNTTYQTKNLRILCTYNAGSPYPKAHQRKQTQDMATADTSQFAARLASSGSRLTQVQNSAGSVAAAQKQWPNQLISQPLLCINMWQHMYLFDYGIRGKRDYLSAWWERIDWDVVYERSTVPAEKSSQTPYSNRVLF